MFIVSAVIKLTNLTNNQEVLIYPSESSIHWILKIVGFLRIW